MKREAHNRLLALKEAIQEILLVQVAPLSEFELIRLLQTPPHNLLGSDALRGSLSLFQTHFLVFHCLYLLREQWRDEHFADLRIEPLAIQIEALATAASQTPVVADPLAEYYLDIEHLQKTDEADVEALLDSFWQQLDFVPQPVTADERSQALVIMELQTMPQNSRQLKREYRQQVHYKHPDKGGSSAAMHELHWAYGILEQALKAGTRS